VVTYDLIDVVKKPSDSVSLESDLPKLPENAVGRVEKLEKLLGFHLAEEILFR